MVRVRVRVRVRARVRVRLTMYCGTEGRPVSQPMTGEMSAWVGVSVGVRVRGEGEGEGEGESGGTRSAWPIPPLQP